MNEWVKEFEIAPSIHLDVLSYSEGLEILRGLHSQVVQEKVPSQIVFMEHNSVITFGKNASWANLVRGRDELERMGVEIVATDRGGEVTAHLPGQLMFYPIINLRHCRLGVRSFVNLIENTLLTMLGEFGIAASLDPAHPGVWHGEAKLCAIGLRIKAHCSLHGASINVYNETDLFKCIVACGIKDRGVTTMQKLLGKKLPISSVRARIDTIFRQQMMVQTDP